MDAANWVEGLVGADCTTDTTAHHRVSVALLDLGLHTMCEKPLALTIKSCDLIIEAARRNGKILSVAENFRRDPISGPGNGRHRRPGDRDRGCGRRRHLLRTRERAAGHQGARQSDHRDTRDDGHLRGVAYVLSNGRGIGIVNSTYNWIGAGRILSIPVAVYVCVIVAGVLIFFMRSTDLGRNIYAIGGNPHAAKLVGINVPRYQVGVYVLTGFVCGIAAVLLTARTTSGQPASGSEGLELETITAAFLGGCAMQGGKGTIVGTILGVLIIGTLNNGMILMQVPTFYQLVAKGLLLLGAVMLMEFRTAKRD